MILAVLVHVAFGLLLGLSLSFKPQVIKPGIAKPVKAIVIDRSTLAKEETSKKGPRERARRELRRNAKRKPRRNVRPKPRRSVRKRPRKSARPKLRRSARPKRPASRRNRTHILR